MASILTETKKMIGIADEDTSFDIDIITHINTVFSNLQQLGVGPEEGFMITDKTATWESFVTGNGLNMVRTYMFLKVKMFFDPPATSFLLDAMKSQVAEQEWRISVFREWDLHPIDPKFEPARRL